MMLGSQSKLGPSQQEHARRLQGSSKWTAKLPHHLSQIERRAAVTTLHMQALRTAQVLPPALRIRAQ